MTKINEFKPESAQTSLVFQTTLTEALCQPATHTFGTNNYYKYWKECYRWCNCVYKNFRKNRFKYNSFAAIGNTIWCFI